MNPPDQIAAHPVEKRTDQPADFGRIDTHSHLLPAIDDGCKTYQDSVACGEALVAAGYTHVFCTPHIWPSLPHNRQQVIVRAVADLQQTFDRKGVGLTLMPGGELNLRADLMKEPDDRIATYNMAGKYVLIDFWADRLPPFFEPVMRYLQNRLLTVVLAHPERLKAVQYEPELAHRFAKMGLLLQGNLQCFADPPSSGTRQVAELFLREGRYFTLGSDCHGSDTLPARLQGLENARKLAGDEVIDKLTKENPRRLMGTPRPRASL
jgi:protein-tyrosine phosphatase